ncbi:HIRAN domain-containing protein [Clostridium pasteurianum DSM 525 = ATCC 6013]|uniref:HIRAN domain-containing protein n=1 Tax=Clostridium pasteurianum DSM 525 = ATCC 6013 TaxID=1262449 RepID=A0A0H3JA08_CLOPA|nr:HIRAN domain-containing protein [Clostridium pasteurianum]AJA49138.1 HIRAN domain-containing protein [Clostridium pasteurianum DSM 525 = ATCC 6013]AJA53126.1 HIRAN domain-containing protein [Clostridium pasteurianum DSM 525 = ATCC 6013]KRU10866.1 HIRAN domain-containing protein [Clostridium pasteurianum DSM 525 = ATCC 6013]UZW13442.1 HIRAN domain-containing protein [Clostridium pasteurianum]
MPTDSLEFIDPIFSDDKNIEREFYIAGVRHYNCCKKADEYAELDLNINENLLLVKDLNNIYDKYAIKITNKQNRLIGYIPVFFSKSVYKAINENRKIKCTIINKECNDSCEECVKVKLTII